MSELYQMSRTVHRLRHAQRVHVGTIFLALFIGAMALSMGAGVFYVVSRVMGEGLQFTVTVDGVPHTYGIK